MSTGVLTTPQEQSLSGSADALLNSVVISRWGGYERNPGYSVIRGQQLTATSLRKGKAMARHDATTWKLPKGYEGLVGSANIEIEVRTSEESLGGKGVGARKRNSDLLGHLLISRGGLEWRPPSGKYHRKMNWERFARLMEGDS